MSLRTLSFVLLFGSIPAFAVDRIVEEFGVSPTYPNINAAVTAAADGDRIVIKNRAGDIPWIETINVAKSLQFLSYANNSFFIVQGNWTITAAPGRAVTIIGMQNTSGNIAGSGSGTARDTDVRLADCRLLNGFINLDTDVFDTQVTGCTLDNGYIYIGFGNVIGNNVDNGDGANDAIQVSPSSSSFAGDTCWVAGNVVTSPTSASYSGIAVYGTAQIYHIRNNYVRYTYKGISFNAGNNSAVQNTVWNNTVTAYQGQFTTYGIIAANTSGNSIWEVMNNVVASTWSGTNRGIYKDSGVAGQVNVYFNHVASGFSTAISSDFTFVGNNTTDQSITLNADGTFLNAPAAVNGGNPSPVFSDLDLSPGDAGAYGGSYSLVNYHPLHTGAARIAHVVFPYNVRQGSTLRVKATAFDR